MIRTTIKIQGTRVYIDPLLQQQALLRIGDRLGTIHRHESQQEYMRNRKTKKLPSFIFNNFNYQSSLKGNEVTTVVSQETPWAVFVDIGFTTPAGNWWEGYHFMEYGSNKAQKQTAQIAREEMQKTMRYVKYAKVKVI
jgi:hypothetical protein